ALFNDVRFRQACNYAMNRQEINDNVFLGFAKLPDNIQDSEYSPEKANALLDEIGMTERDSNGFRLSPDGQEVRILIEYPAAGQMYGLKQATELFAAQLQEVGINAEPRATDDAVLSERAVSKDVQIGAWETYINATDRDALFTVTPGWIEWCPDWSWWEGNPTGTERPADMPDEFVAYVQAVQDRIQYVPRVPEDAALYENLLSIYKDYFWAIVTVTNVPTTRIISHRLGNIARAGATTSSGYCRGFEVVYIKQ
ncbi:MAG: hypothetical protein GX601_07335, partial [Anaerolineales bacterium]|nr:hypothetical protein [Anaerolineales bacterium]